MDLEFKGSLGKGVKVAENKFMTLAHVMLPEKGEKVKIGNIEYEVGDVRRFPGRADDMV